MKIEVLGTGGAVSDLSTAYLVEDSILIDCGLDIVKKLLKEDKLKNIEHVFLTHLHMDHVSGFELLVFYLQYVKKEINVYAGYDFIAFYSALKCSMTVDSKYYQPFKLNIISKDNTFCVKEFVIKAFNVSHMKDSILAYGFNIKSYKEDVQVIISGDTDKPLNITAKMLEKENIYCFHDMGLTGVDLPEHLDRVHPTEEQIYLAIGESNRIFGIHLSDSAKLFKYARAIPKEYIFTGEPL